MGVNYSKLPIAMIYIVDLKHPNRQIIMRDCYLQTRKQSWALETISKFGPYDYVAHHPRHLIGSSAFFTLAAAERAKLGLMVTLSQNSYVRYNHPKSASYAAEQVASYLKHGTFIPPKKVR